LARRIVTGRIYYFLAEIGRFMAETITDNKTQNEEYWLPCGKCNRNTRHKVRQSVEVNGEEDWGYNYWERYQIVQCQGCDVVSFRESRANSEDTIDDEEKGKSFPLEAVNLYPSRIAGRQELRQVHLLPRKVARIYSETHSALCNNQPVLTGVGIRALVETVCQEKAAAGHDLKQKIDNLVTKGVLTTTGADILHKMRVLGNKAAHEVEPHSEETLNVAMDVIEHLLQDVYILLAITAKLPKK
jgi:hypothetical protein